VRHTSTDAGILVSNLGSPDSPTPSAVRRYLREFLGDPRVVDAPRTLWWAILNLVILPLRTRRSAARYRSIWTADGSPLAVITDKQAAALQTLLEERSAAGVKVEVGMRYGHPSVAEGLRRLRDHGCRRVIVLPLYPQYSATTTASVCDAVARELASWSRLPELHTVTSYADHQGYIRALAAAVRDHWSRSGAGDRLLISFHGIPTRYADAGDPYPEQCRETARLLAAELSLAPERWTLSFQSRFGRGRWIGPATDAQLTSWGGERLALLDVVCPGFAADCLETLEEIAIDGRRVFETAGGGELRYVPALNERPDHIEALADIASQFL